MRYKQNLILFLNHSAKYFQIYTALLAGLIAVWISGILLPLSSSMEIVNILFHALIPLLIVVLSLVWITLWGWYYSFFRYLPYACAMLSNLIRKLLKSWWMKFSLFLAAAVLFRARWLLLPGKKPSWEEFIKNFFSFESLLLTFGIILGLILIYQVLEARKRLVISRFVNQTGLEEMESAVKSIGTRILNEMSRLNDLLIDIDKMNSREKKGLLENTLIIQDIGKNLEEMVGSHSRVEIGSFLRIPMDLFYAFVIRILQGRVLRGSLHKNGDRLILTARLRGGGRNKTWRVNSDDIEDPVPAENTEKVVKMTDQLMCRIFTDLAKGAPPRWRAVKHYTQGLRLFRQSVKTEIKRKINLLNAKQAFINSLKVYKYFGQCYYNLGIVYSELENLKAAEASFREGLRIEPENFDCYFKLALLYFYNNKNPVETRWLCGEAMAIAPTHPYTWNLLGVSYFNEWKTTHPEFVEYKNNNSRKNCCIQRSKIDDNIIVHLRNATLLAWKKLCLTIKKGENPENERLAAAISLLNLGKAQRRKKKSVCAPTFRQSLFFFPEDNEIYYELGTYYYCQGKLKKAFKAFARVYKEDENINHCRFWALYSKAAARLYKIKKNKTNFQYKELIVNNYIHFLDAAANFIQDVTPEPSDKNSIAYKNYKKGVEDFLINAKIMSTALEDIEEKKKAENIFFLVHLKEHVRSVSNTEHASSRLKDILTNLKDNHNNYIIANGKWVEAQLKLAAGKQLIRNTKKETIETGIGYLSAAYRDLHEQNSLQIKKQKISMKIAEGFFKTKQYKAALFHTRIALNHNPFSTGELQLLGDIYFGIKDYKNGLKAWKDSFHREPPSHERIEEMGHTCVEAGEKIVDRDLRQLLFNEVIEFLKQLQKLMENHPIDSVDQGQQVTKLELIHYYLGVCLRELMQYEQSVYHLRIAINLNDIDFRAYNMLGWTLFDMKLLDKAAEVFRRADEKSKSPKLVQQFQNIFFIEEMKLGLILCQISQETSFIYYKDPKKFLEQSFKRINKLENLEDKNRLLALYYECRGQIALKKIQKKSLLKIILPGKYKVPIKIFEQSVAHNPTPRVYYHLASTYCHYAQKANPTKRNYLVHDARRAVDLCCSHDLRGQYKNSNLNVLSLPELSLNNKNEK